MSENVRKCQVKLHTRQINAARMVAWGRSEKDIEKLLDVNPRTLYRWKKIPEFIMECDKVIERQYEEMCYRMQDIALSSVEAVWQELQNRSEGSHRVQVAMNMLKLLGIERVMEGSRTANYMNRERIYEKA